jgi:NAD(P)H-hydrate epimerase
LSLADADPARFDLVVDALFGTGLARDLDGEVADLIGRVNAAGRPVLAIDIPSGVDADSGLVRGAAVKASRTVTFACRKPGHVLYPGRAHAGPVEVADIGVPVAGLDGPVVAANAPALWLSAYPRPGPEAHKYHRGHALVVSGAAAHTGAARLAARGALRAGAGLVSVVTSARALAVNAAHLTAIMMRVCDDPDEFYDLLADDRFNAIVLGPALGVGDLGKRWVEAALDADRATVLDADALTSFSGEAESLAALTRAPRETPVVLTPHEGELKRLLAGSGETSVEAREIAGRSSKLDRALGLAALTNAIVVLKGPDTIIAGPNGRAAINENGSPYLGTAGSGDVLAGIIAGLMAQGMLGFEAACCAVWMHAEAGARFGPGLIAEDLPELLPGVMREFLF